MSDLKLVIANRNYSSWSMRAWLAARATGASFEEVMVPLDRPETREELLSHSPSGKVPALIHGQLTVWDSLAICEYLAELHPEAGLWPEGPAVRAVARSVTAEMHSGFMSLRSHMPMNLRARRPGTGRGPMVGEDVDRVVAIWEWCRPRYGEGGDLLFGSFTIADAFFAPVVSRFRTYGVSPGGVAQGYMDAVWALPDVQEWAAAAEVEPWSIPKYDAPAG